MPKCKECKEEVYRPYIEPRTRATLCFNCATVACQFCGKRVERWTLVFLPPPHAAVCYQCNHTDGQRYVDYCKEHGGKNIGFKSSVGIIL